MRSGQVGSVLVVIVAAGLAGCGAGSRGAQYGEGDYGGEYLGPDVMDLTVTSPISRALPPESNTGRVLVVDSGATTMRITVEFDTGGTPCILTAERNGTFATIGAGQTCTAKMTYDGAPVLGTVQIRTGTMSFNDSATSVAMQGPFTATIVLNGSSIPVRGLAAWRFEGVVQ
jgi:hypothetical protein